MRRPGRDREQKIKGVGERERARGKWERGGARSAPENGFGRPKETASSDDRCGRHYLFSFFFSSDVGKI